MSTGVTRKIYGDPIRVIWAVSCQIRLGILESESGDNLYMLIQRVEASSMSSRQELPRQGIGLASPDNSVTSGSTTCEADPVSWERIMQPGGADRYRLHALEEVIELEPKASEVHYQDARLLQVLLP